jgi:hypothetical protein
MISNQREKGRRSAGEVRTHRTNRCRIGSIRSTRKGASHEPMMLTRPLGGGFEDLEWRPATDDAALVQRARCGEGRNNA